MKLLILLVLSIGLNAADINSCFKVHDLKRSDIDHYWSVWSYSCSEARSSVYVMVDFFSGLEKIGKGVFAIYVPRSGGKTLNRWTAPIDLPVGVIIKVNKITIDSIEALK